MSFPASSSYPTSVWDGGSDTRKTANDHESPLSVHRDPDAEDFSQIQAEVIKTQTILTRQTGAGNTAALALAATSGHGYLPTCAGTPTGVPTAITGFAAMVYDTTAHKLWIYDSGWKTGGAIS
jgi:hypothetical protein